jgi:hypothetical protein
LANFDWEYLLSLNAGLNRTTSRRTPTTPTLPRVQSLPAVSIIDTFRPGCEGLASRANRAASGPYRDGVGRVSMSERATELGGWCTKWAFTNRRHTSQGLVADLDRRLNRERITRSATATLSSPIVRWGKRSYRGTGC